MTRDKAIETMDALAEAGYSVSLSAHNWGDHRPINDEPINYRVEIVDMGVDKVDLRHLVNLADQLGLDVGAHALGQSRVIFSDLDTTPEVVRSRRRHPLAAQRDNDAS